MASGDWIIGDSSGGVFRCGVYNFETLRFGFDLFCFDLDCDNGVCFRRHSYDDFPATVVSLKWLEQP
jgi:hypothetical protein